MNRLIVDNSNTRTKFALLSAGSFVEQRVISTADISVDSVRVLLRGWEYAEAGICSVVPQAAKLIAEACHPACVKVLSPLLPLTVDFSGYAGIDTLGADRVANIVEAVWGREFPMVAVDLGTATTFDVADERNGKACFLGGVIAPGMAAFAGCLQGRTALLPAASIDSVGPVIGGTTHEAMASAVRVGYPAMVDGILDHIEQQLGKNIHVVLTGGDAQRVAPMLRRQCKIAPLLTLNGIAKALGMLV